MSMAAEEGRCGPLCQHPGCWYSGEKNRVHYHKSRGYLDYLEGLSAKRSALQKPESTSPVGGLPTLKVQSIDEDTHLYEHHHHHKRSHTLPPVRTHRRPHSQEDHGGGDGKKVSFVQMMLKAEEQKEDVSFSPVLIWKPGHTHRKRVFLKPPTSPSEESRGRITPHGGKGTRSFVAMKTTDLTETLPPERTESALERKATPKSLKGQKRLNTADVESFSYLGDIPPHIVAQILEQLRSESSSNIDEVHSRPVTSNPVHQATVPTSIMYSLSSKKIHRTSELSFATPPHSGKKKKLTSFSRELSQKPLEVLRRRSVNMKTRVEEGPPYDCSQSRTESHGTKTKVHFPPSLPEAITHHCHTGRHSGVRYPLGNPVVSRIPQKPSHDEEYTHASDVIKSTGRLQGDNLLQIVPCISPRTVTFQGGVTKTKPEDQWKEPHKRAHVVHVPRHHLPTSAKAYTNRPYSEEASIITPDSITSKRLEDDPVQRPLSISPDYMLVGAQFSGNQLVLLNSEGQIIHQLTETESEANVAMAFSATSVGGSSEIPVILCDQKPPVGMRAPPSTATSGARTHHKKSTESELATTREEEDDCSDNSATVSMHTEAGQDSEPTISMHTEVGQDSEPTISMHTEAGQDSEPTVSVHTEAGPDSEPTISVHTEAGQESQPTVSVHTEAGPDTISVPTEAGPDSEPTISVHTEACPGSEPTISVHTEAGPDSEPTISVHTEAGPDIEPTISAHTEAGPVSEPTFSMHTEAGQESEPTISVPTEAGPDSEPTISVHTEAGQESEPTISVHTEADPVSEPTIFEAAAGYPPDSDDPTVSAHTEMINDQSENPIH